MQIFWKVERAFIKDVITEMPEPKPHYNTMATMIKILEEKGFLSHETVGNIFKYFPLVSKESYQRFAMKDIVSHYFNDSYSSMLTFFAKEQKISEEELKDIIKLIKTGDK